MAKVLVYYAHPGQRHSTANKALSERARRVAGVSFVDLYAEYPRFDIDVDVEQQRLLAHDVVVLQFPMFWYSTPALMKEWIDLVLEHGFAYGKDGDRLRGKYLQLAITTSGDEAAYSDRGYQRFPLRTFLTPLEQTAHLCGMHFPAPYVLHAALRAEKDGRLQRHIDGYVALLEAFRADRYDFAVAESMSIVTAGSLPLKGAN